MAFFLVSGEEEGVEVVEKLVGVVLRWSSIELRRECGGFSQERWVLPPWLSGEEGKREGGASV